MPYSIFRVAQAEYLLRFEKACQDHSTIPGARWVCFRGDGAWWIRQLWNTQAGRLARILLNILSWQRWFYVIWEASGMPAMLYPTPLSPSWGLFALWRFPVYILVSNSPCLLKYLWPCFTDSRRRPDAPVGLVTVEWKARELSQIALLAAADFHKFCR